ncbi:MAG: hypothetical protein EA411_13220 [Saprospirales bacterium]|nr:MAG: hypothetical protein EA411_13220 [Saprospirales bacterium]
MNLVGILLVIGLSFPVEMSAQDTKSELAITADFQYTFMEFGKLHGINVPVSIQWNINNHILTGGLGVGYGLSNWNFGNDPSKNYNLDIDYSMPPYAGIGSTSFFIRNFIELNGTSGHGSRWFAQLGYGRSAELFDRSFELIAGWYYTRVNTSFIAEVLEDQIIYNRLFGNGPDGEPIPFETELLIPISIIYSDMGPYFQFRYEIFNDWKIPMGISASYYHGFDDNSWFNLGIFLDMQIKTH